MSSAIVLPICVGIVSILFCTVIGFAKGWSGVGWFFIGLAHAVVGFFVSCIFSEVLEEALKGICRTGFVYNLIFWIGIATSAFGLLVITLIPCKREKTNLNEPSLEQEEPTLDENN